MTLENDKLPAISGYAHSIQKHVHGKYFSGLWECDFHSGLLWIAYSGAKPCKTRAPSWSWASLNGGIHYPCGSTHVTPDEHCITIIECSVELSSNDPMGQVSSGLLKCRGPLSKVLWRRGERPWSVIAVILRDVDELVEEDSRTSFPFGLLDTIPWDCPPHLWCLLVVKNQGLVNRGLILELSPHDNKYRRVGQFTFPDDSWTSKWPVSTIMIV
jgi:hypothetical protein